MKVAFNLSETSTELKLQLPFKMFDPVLDFVLGIIREDLGESNGQQSKQLLQNFMIFFLFSIFTGYPVNIENT